MPSDFRRQVLLFLMKLLDLAAVCGGFVAALAVSTDSVTLSRVSELLMIRVKVSNILLFVAFLGICWAIFTACGMYESHRLSHWPRRLREVLTAVTLATVALIAMRSGIRLAFATNAFLGAFWGLTACAVLLLRESVRLALHFLRRHGRNLRDVIIIAEKPDAIALQQEMATEAGLGYRVLRVINIEDISK
jgi:FlaA1/EpsC-like NDP-sugar epimerase